jgi:hypothetical protein
MPNPADPKQFFGTVAINETCSVDGCGQTAEGVLPIHEGGTTDVWWLCADHADAIDPIFFTGPVPANYALSQVHVISLTCRYSATETLCGSVATHVAIVGVVADEGRPQLAVVSVCPRHAAEAAWGPPG